MKNVIIIGAGGSLARFVIEELEKQNEFHLTLFLRNRNRLTKKPINATIVEGDVMDYTKLKDAINGQDIVYINLAGNLEAMAKNIVKAMKETGVKRVIAISSIGIYQTPLKPVLQPYRKLADVIEASGLDYTILRPDWFTNANEIDYQLIPKGEPEAGTAVSRKSIAGFIRQLVDNPEKHVRENLNIAKPA
jgi:uncharacterized protein YbjT (DUF2867 family)